MHRPASKTYNIPNIATDGLSCPFVCSSRVSINVIKSLKNHGMNRDVMNNVRSSGQGFVKIKERSWYDAVFWQHLLKFIHFYRNINVT